MNTSYVPFLGTVSLLRYVKIEASASAVGPGLYIYAFILSPTKLKISLYKYYTSTAVFDVGLTILFVDTDIISANPTTISFD